MTNKEFLAVGGIGPGSASPALTGRSLGAAAGPVGQGQFGARAGISGVRSTSTATSIVVYRGQTAYSQFPFDYIVALQRMGGAGAGSPRLGGDPGGGRAGLRGGLGAPLRPGDEVAPVFPGTGRFGQPGPGRGIGQGRGVPVAPGRGP